MTEIRASPICYAATADDVYMGYAGREELLAALNELLEAERAGARVARRSQRDAVNPSMLDLIKDVRDDEARWCAMLTRQIVQMGGMPSQICGAFYERAMAISDVIDRLRFLNRGQSWVVRRLTALLPRVRDDDLHRDLRFMLDRHAVNIGRTAVLVQTVSAT